MKKLFLAAVTVGVSACTTTTPPANAPAAQQAVYAPQSFQRTGDFVQEMSGMILPESVGDFERTTITRFRTDGSEISASYAKNKNGPRSIDATVYSYAGLVGAIQVESEGESELFDQFLANMLGRELGCQQEWADAQNAIVQRFEGAKVLDEGQMDLVNGDRTFNTQFVRYTFSSQPGLREPDFATELYLICPVGSAWSVKYRFTYERFDGARAAIDAFMNDLAITIPDDAGTDIQRLLDDQLDAAPVGDTGIET